MCRLTISVTFTLSILLLYVNNCFACNGYKMRLISVENCGSDNVVTIDSNFTANLSEDCILTSIGCLHSKGFKEAKVKYSIIKDGHELLTGHPDVCNALDQKNQEQKEKLEMFGFPTECPVPEGQKCLDESRQINVSKYKDLLAFAKLLANMMSHMIRAKLVQWSSLKFRTKVKFISFVWLILAILVNVNHN